MNLQLDPLHTINAETFNKKCSTKIEAVYGAVVEFIEWYNTIKQVPKVDPKDHCNYSDLPSPSAYDQD
jgi:hypothetical protein